MNCKQGDLAVIVSASNRLMLGKFVTCIRRYDGPWRNGDVEPGWVIDQEIKVISSSGEVNVQSVITDEALRPIRNDPGQDETIAWAGLPGELEIPVQEVAA